MRFKLDENLGKAAANVLQSAAHDVQTVREQGLSRASEHEVIGICQSEERCLVTLDLDFANPLLFHPVEYGGIACSACHLVRHTGTLSMPVRPSSSD